MRERIYIARTQLRTIVQVVRHAEQRMRIPRLTPKLDEVLAKSHPWADDIGIVERVITAIGLKFAGLTRAYVWFADSFSGTRLFFGPGLQAFAAPMIAFFSSDKVIASAVVCKFLL